MFITLTFRSTGSGYERLRVNPNYIIGIFTEKDEYNKGKPYTVIRHIDGHWKVKESQEEVIDLINAALQKKDGTYEEKSKALNIPRKRSV